MKSRMDKYEELLAMCAELKVTPAGWCADQNLKKAVERARAGLPEGFLRNLHELQEKVKNSIIFLEKLEQGDTIEKFEQ